MDQFTIEIEKDESKLNFQIIDYAHNDDDNRCKFEVFTNGKMVASFEPDSRGFLHICKNSGEIDESILHLIADKIESLSF